MVELVRHRLCAVCEEWDRAQSVFGAGRLCGVAVGVCAQSNVLLVPFVALVPQAHRALVRDEGGDLVAVDQAICESGMSRYCRSGGSRDARGSLACGRSR